MTDNPLELDHEARDQANLPCGATYVDDKHMTKTGRIVTKVWECNRPRWVPHTEHRVTDHKARVRKSWTSP